MKLPHIEQSVVIRLTSVHCGSPTTKIYSQWESIFDGLNQNHKEVLDTYKPENSFLKYLAIFCFMTININTIYSDFFFCKFSDRKKKLSSRCTDVIYDLREWISKNEINNYKLWHMDFDYTFTDLHINDENRKYGEGLYTFNAADFPNYKQCEKVLHHFYQLCDSIFGEVRSCL